MKNYINYKVYFMPEVYGQRIKVNKVPKLFITINDQPYFPGVIASYDDNMFDFRYRILLDITDKIFGALELVIFEYAYIEAKKYNEKLYRV